ncbi:TPA: SIR2 family protein [Vibrio cholerae]|nr:SIR2 family protein [Vibrio cholerae]HCJ7283016.1 SIR2 family protein [Vibrio cholerae]HCJ7314527.1 SIR2 family protein [Vibrio cholerae]HCJ7321269.1 SIR2 family protein [Vibrio cholerae]
MLKVIKSGSLKNVIKNNKKDIALLIGSPLSAPDEQGGLGVPNVRGVLEIIDDVVTDLDGLKEEYLVEVEGLRDTEKYQKAFTFLQENTSQDEINQIIRRAVLKSTYSYHDADVSDVYKLNELTSRASEWYIPSATEALAKLVVSSNKITGPIFTTNFDPLLTIALDKLGVKASRTVLHNDCRLSQYQPGTTHIIHLHGYWTDTDTLHTPEQLTFNRPNLKDSLKRILAEKTLLVLGYGGWDDVFTDVLFEIVNSDSNIDILWAFFDDDSDRINKSFSDLIKKVEAATHRNRFRAFGGVDCHKFLQELAFEVSSVKSTKVVENTLDNVSKNYGESKNADSESLVCLLKDNNKILNGNVNNIDSPHNYIRDSERAQVVEVLKDNKFINIYSDWGCSRKEFIDSICEAEDSPYKKYVLIRLDLENVNSKEELIRKVEEKYNTSLPNYIDSLPIEYGVLCFENVNCDSNEKSIPFNDVLLDLINIILDYKPNIVIIVSSNKKLSHEFPSIKINKLEEYDIKNYLNFYRKLDGSIKDDEADCIGKLSKGTPFLIDKYVNELKYFAIEDIIEQHYSPSSYDTEDAFNSDLPSEIKILIDKLSSSYDSHDKQSYELLKVLSIIEHGDAFNNLKKCNSKTSFKPNQIKDLMDLGLVEMIDLGETIFNSGDNNSAKIYKISSVARNYVYSQMTIEDVYEVSKQIAKVHLGPKWKTARININGIVKDQIKRGYNLGSTTSSILIQLLKCAIDLGLSNDIRAIYNASMAYCNYLRSVAKKYVQLENFCSEVRAITRDVNSIDNIYLLDLYEGTALRMQSKMVRAEECLHRAYLKLDKFIKDDRVYILNDLAMLYYSTDRNDLAMELASKALIIDPAQSTSKLILAQINESNDINNLKDLEKSNRSNGNTITANNAAFSLCKLEELRERKVYWLDRIIKGDKDAYNKYRAVTEKGKLFISENFINITPNELVLLNNAYVYGFNQKFSRIFNEAHEILWKYYVQTNNVYMLALLFKHSSLYWRIYEDYKRERKFSALLSDILLNGNESTIDRTRNYYVIVRIKQISPNYGVV